MMRLLAAFLFFTFFGLVAWFFLARVNSPYMTPAEALQVAQSENEIIEEIKAQKDALWDALFRGDAEGVASIWTSDGEIIEAEGWFRGRYEIRSFLSEFFKTGSVTSGGEEYLEWFVRGEVVYLISLAHETVQIEGQEPISLEKLCTSRWIRENGAWKMERTVNGRTDDLPFR